MRGAAGVYLTMWMVCSLALVAEKLWRVYTEEPRSKDTDTWLGGGEGSDEDEDDMEGGEWYNEENNSSDEDKSMEGWGWYKQQGSEEEGNYGSDEEEDEYGSNEEHMSSGEWYDKENNSSDEDKSLESWGWYKKGKQGSDEGEEKESEEDMDSKERYKYDEEDSEEVMEGKERDSAEHSRLEGKYSSRGKNIHGNYWNNYASVDSTRKNLHAKILNNGNYWYNNDAYRGRNDGHDWRKKMVRGFHYNNKTPYGHSTLENIRKLDKNTGKLTHMREDKTTGRYHTNIFNDRAKMHFRGDSETNFQGATRNTKMEAPRDENKGTFYYSYYDGSDSVWSKPIKGSLFQLNQRGM